MSMPLDGLPPKTREIIKIMLVGAGIATIGVNQGSDFLERRGLIPQSPVPTNPSYMDMRSQEKFIKMAEEVDDINEVTKQLPNILAQIAQTQELLRRDISEDHARLESGQDRINRRMDR